MHANLRSAACGSQQANAEFLTLSQPFFLDHCYFLRDITHNCSKSVLTPSRCSPLSLWCAFSPRALQSSLWSRRHFKVLSTTTHGRNIYHLSTPSICHDYQWARSFPPSLRRVVDMSALLHSLCFPHNLDVRGPLRQATTFTATMLTWAHQKPTFSIAQSAAPLCLWGWLYFRS